jgi:hypothetical protein
MSETSTPAETLGNLSFFQLGCVGSFLWGFRQLLSASIAEFYYKTAKMILEGKFGEDRLTESAVLFYLI